MYTHTRTHTRTHTHTHTHIRIIVAGNLLNYTVENSAVVFNFDVEYGLNELEAKRVSDHYPIEMTLTSS